MKPLFLTSAIACLTTAADHENLRVASLFAAPTPAVSSALDDPNLIAYGGLEPVVRLAEGHARRHLALPRRVHRLPAHLQRCLCDEHPLQPPTPRLHDSAAGRRRLDRIGPAGPGPSYLGPGSGGPENDFTNRNTAFMTWNLMHLAAMLERRKGIPAHGNQRSEWDAGCASMLRTRTTVERPAARCVGGASRRSRGTRKLSARGDRDAHQRQRHTDRTAAHLRDVDRVLPAGPSRTWQRRGLPQSRRRCSGRRAACGPARRVGSLVADRT